MATIIERIQVATGTAAQWTSQNPTLLAGEFGWESDTGKVKIGDGASTWTTLGYQDAKFVPAYLASGTATLSAGTIAVTGLTSATANTVVKLGYKTTGGTPGAVFISARTAGTGFTIKSTSSTDTSVISYDVVAW